MAVSKSNTSPQAHVQPHTPGPWEFEVHELSSGFSGIVYGANGMRIGTDHLSEADARLIAAAPDLLEALEAMVLNDHHTYRDCHKRALAAIRKATGADR